MRHSVVKRFTAMFRKSLARRVKATILYATETGRSATYAKKVGELFSHNFEKKVRTQKKAFLFYLLIAAGRIVLTLKTSLKLP